MKSGKARAGLPYTRAHARTPDLLLARLLAARKLCAWLIVSCMALAAGWRE